MPRRYSDWITAYVSELSPRGEAPERFHFWTAASMIAGALRRRVYLDMQTFRWYPNMYVVLVAPPGVMKKSTAIGIGTRILREVPNVQFGADCVTWQEFVQQVEEARDMFAEGDATASLMDEVHTVTCALTVSISEWGNFLHVDDMEMINILTELWDCRIDVPFVKATKTQGDNVIMNPFVNMIAATTPAWMRANFRSKFGGWGFSSRCIFLYASKAERHIAYPDELWDGKFDAVVASLRSDLEHISQLQGKFTLAPEARALGHEWNESLCERRETLTENPNHDPWLAYYLARKFDHVHKLCMILSASRNDSLIITREDMNTAIDRCNQVETELRYIFGNPQAEQTRDRKRAEDVWNGLSKGIAKLDRIPQHRAFDFSINFMDYGESQRLLDHLCAARWLQREQATDGSIWYTFGENARVCEEVKAILEQRPSDQLPETFLAILQRTQQSPGVPVRQ